MKYYTYMNQNAEEQLFLLEPQTTSQLNVLKQKQPTASS